MLLYVDMQNGDGIITSNAISDADILLYTSLALNQVIPLTTTKGCSDINRPRLGALL
jgi:hypothetical protein